MGKPLGDYLRLPPGWRLALARHPLTLLLAVVRPALFPDQFWLALIVQPLLLGLYTYAVVIEPLGRTAVVEHGVLLHPAAVLSNEANERSAALASAFHRARSERIAAEADWDAGDAATTETLARLRGEELMVQLDAEESSWRALWQVHQPGLTERLVWLLLALAGVGSALYVLAHPPAGAEFLAEAIADDPTSAALTAFGVVILATVLKGFRAPPVPS